MKRIEKLNLLTKLLQGRINAEQLQRALPPEPVIFIIGHGASDPQPDDLITFHNRGELVTIPYGELDEYVRRNGSGLMIVLPDNGRDAAEQT